MSLRVRFANSAWCQSPPAFCLPAPPSVWIEKSFKKVTFLELATDSKQTFSKFK